MSAFLNSFATNPTAFDPTSAASVLVPAKGVRGTYSVNYAPGIVPDHVDLANLTPADLEADAIQYGTVTLRINNVVIQALRNAFGDVIYRINGKQFDAIEVSAMLANAFALAQ
jgi:hypothetical protein